jgi:hypothetical protein
MFQVEGSVGLSYTVLYRKTYEEWAEAKAKRIRGVLRTFHERNVPLDIQDLASKVYRERLLADRKRRWKPVYGFLLDKKPSAFMKNFVEHLLERMVDEGFAEVWFIVSAEAWGVRRTLSTQDVYEVPDLIVKVKGLMVEELGEEVLEEIKVSIKREARILKLPNLEWLEKCGT